jgi:hypothetical protein
MSLLLSPKEIPPSIIYLTPRSLSSENSLPASRERKTRGRGQTRSIFIAEPRPLSVIMLSLSTYYEDQVRKGSKSTFKNFNLARYGSLCLSLIPALRRPKHKDHEFKASLGYIVRPCLKKLILGWILITPQ